MPIHLQSLSRRRFLRGIAAAGAGLVLTPRAGWGADSVVDPKRIALISDTHIDKDPKTVSRNVVMFDHLKQIASEISGLERRPSAAFVCGDLAYLAGLPGDYTTFIDLVKPIREAGVPLHLALGNHDERANFWQAVPPAESNRVVESRHVGLVESAGADWVVLDSLMKTNFTPGQLGKSQIAWLMKTLEAKKDRPVILMVHHNPVAESGKIPGLTDAKDLFEQVLPLKQVKAIFFGHTHHWSVTEKDGLHLVNLPAAAYPFAPAEPTGWVDFQYTPEGAQLQLLCTDPKHPRHHQEIQLKWRA